MFSKEVWFSKSSELINFLVLLSCVTWDVSGMAGDGGHRTPQSCPVVSKGCFVLREVFRLRPFR